MLSKSCVGDEAPSDLSSECEQAATSNDKDDFPVLSAVIWNQTQNLIRKTCKSNF